MTDDTERRLHAFTLQVAERLFLAAEVLSIVAERKPKMSKPRTVTLELTTKEAALLLQKIKAAQRQAGFGSNEEMRLRKIAERLISSVPS